MRWLLLLALAACDHPGLANAPRAPTPIVAGAAAAAAAITTAIDPDFASRSEEENKVDPERPDTRAAKKMPSDVLDRLDDAQSPPGN